MKKDTFILFWETVVRIRCILWKYIVNCKCYIKIRYFEVSLEKCKFHIVYVQWESLTVPKPNINNQNYYFGLYFLCFVSEVWFLIPNLIEMSHIIIFFFTRQHTICTSPTYMICGLWREIRMLLSSPHLSTKNTR